MFSGASNTVEGVDSAFVFIIGVSLIFLVILTFIMIYFVVRYRKEKNPTASQIEGNTTLEIIWTVVPTILVLVMFFYGWVGFDFMRNVPDDAMKVKAIARMWSFTFEYENGMKSDKLIIPIDKPVKVELVATDVLHAFYIPAFRVKEDMVPGKDNYLWFTAQKEGSYDIFCAEYCGMLHSAMITKAEVVSPEKFESWLAGESLDGEASDGMAGLSLLQNNGCIACHSIDGSKLIGPTFKGIFGRKVQVEVDGEVREIDSDENYIIKSIYEPNAEIVSGYSPNMMVSYKNQIGDEEMQAIVDYLKTLE